jgi:hypothetical protein
MLAVGLFAFLASTARADDTQPPPPDPPPAVTLPADPDPPPDPAPSVTSPTPHATPTHHAPKHATRAPSSATPPQVRTRWSNPSTVRAATPHRERHVGRHTGASKHKQAPTLSPVLGAAAPILGRPARERLPAFASLKVAAQSHSPSGSGSGAALLITFALCFSAAVALFLVPGVLPFPVIPQLRRPARARAPVASVPGGGATTCEVRLFRGDVKSQFYAEVALPQGKTSWVVAQSGWFRWREDEEPEPLVRVARDQLLAALAAKGWVRLGRGSEWYSDRLVRAGRA